MTASHHPNIRVIACLFFVVLVQKGSRHIIMSRNYSVIHYIQNQLKGFNPKFVDCVVRCFNTVDQIHEPDGCLSNSVALFICAKEYGYNPVLCYGLCELAGNKFYHVWLEINGIIIDISIYGNVNFNPYFIWNITLDKPYIGSYEDSIVRYGKFEFDEDWSDSMISKAEGWSFEKYMNRCPYDAMWKRVCKFLDKSFIPNVIKYLKILIENETIERH